MSYQEKRTYTNIITGLLVLVTYCLYAFGNYQPADAVEDLKYFAGTMLVFIGIGIAAAIVIQIVFHILLSIGIAVQKKVQDENYDEKLIEKQIQSEMVEDEMDKLIELKSMRVGFFIAGVGFVAGLVALVTGSSPSVMLNILFISFSTGSLFEGVTQLYYYHNGVRNA